MSSSAHTISPVAVGRGSTSYVSQKPDGTLVALVHGFRGRALRTWGDMAALLDTHECLRAADFLFYGYSSRVGRIQNMAISLRESVDRIWANPLIAGALPTRTLDGNEVHRWTRVLFVAHSMGAVVVRRAILDSLLDQDDPDHWSRRSSFCFFAPAHMGVDLQALLKETFSAIGLPILPAARAVYPCLSDLDYECSTLVQLRQDALDLRGDHLHEVCSRSVILGERDVVINPARFPGDRVATQLAGQGHVSVCKPSSAFLEPLDSLTNVWTKDDRFRSLLSG